MKAVYITDYGGSERLKILNVERPTISRSNQVLVNVKAAGLNRADILQRKGLYPAPIGFPQNIPGLEFAGVVEEIGESVQEFDKGDRVFGITSGGGQAEFVLTEERQLMRIPDHLDFQKAAAIPEAFITAHDAVWTQGRLAEGETLLIHAIGSGVGLAALEIAKIKGNRVFGSSRTQAKLDRARDIRLGFGINTSENPEFERVIDKETDGRGVDVVLDLVGGKFFLSNLKCLATKGRLILVGLVGGRSSDFDLSIALRKRLQIIGTVLRSRSAIEKAEATSNFSREILPSMDENHLNARVDSVFPVEEIQKAHKYLESNANFGKVVIEF